MFANTCSEVIQMKSKRVQQEKYRRQRARRSRQIFERILLTICIIALLAIGGSAILTKATTTDEASEVYYTYYMEYEIQNGDSLWDIAGEYMVNGPYETRNEYALEVMRINHLTSTTIISGHHLVIPYYDATYY